MCERGFSRVGQIKQDNRASLQNEHLEGLLRVSLADIDIQKLYSEYSKSLINTWKTEKQRRRADKHDKPL